MKGCLAGPVNVVPGIRLLVDILNGMCMPEQKEKWESSVPPTLIEGTKLILLREKEQAALFSEVFI